MAGAPGIGDPYFPHDGNGGIDVQSYEVHDAYRFSGGLLSGWTTVTLRTTEQLSSFDLDFLLPVRSVHLSTGGSTLQPPVSARAEDPAAPRDRGGHDGARAGRVRRSPRSPRLAR